MEVELVVGSRNVLPTGELWSRLLDTNTTCSRCGYALLTIDT